MDELPGHIGPYEVKDRLGHGGMGVVYLGFDPMLDRPVAIKVLKVPDEETRRRFLREARLAARVHHPHIVSIYAVGEHEGNPYLAMEFIAGRTMAQVIRGGDQVPLARKVHWLSELCAGLGHAHESGIVHRDVKPSNLLIAQGSGMLRLLDFGIAHGNETSSMTMAGMIVGTPQYMSPEQITGQPVDARSDIFSVGVVAYELLTGRQAFGGDNLYNISRQIVGEQPRPIESFAPDVPNALVKTIAKCLQKEPGSRAGNAKVLEREFLAIARRLDPEHTLLVVPTEATVVTPHARDATMSRRELMRETEEAIEQGELTTASGLLHKLESGTSPSPDVMLLRQKLQARRLALRLQEAIARADEATQTGSLEDAEAAINALADLSPRHPELARLRKAHQERIDERQVAALTSRARQALQQDRLDEAEALLAEALSLAPDASDALALQQKLSARTRAQRIARLVAQASRALDQEDESGARRAIDALTRIDAAHRDVSRLQTRLAALVAEAQEAPAARTGPSRPIAPVPAVVAPAVLAPAGAAPLSAPPLAAPAPPQVSKPVAKPPAAPKPRDSAAAPPSAPAAIAKPAPEAGLPAIVPGPDARTKLAAPAAEKPISHAAPTPAGDGLLLRHAAPVDSHAEESPTPIAKTDAAETTPSRVNPALLAVAALVLLVIAGAGLYYQFGRAPKNASPAVPQEVSKDSGATTTPAPPAVVAPPTAADPPGPVVEPPPPSAETVAVPPSSPAGPPTDPWATARQLSRDGKYDRAMGAVEQVKGVPPASMQEERGRIVESARRSALAARRVADDMRTTNSPEYVLGMTRQAQADRDQKAGRLRAAVNGYVQAHDHFQQALHDSGRVAANPKGGAGKDGGAGSGNVETGPAPAPAPAPSPPSQPSVDLSTWSNVEAHASIAQFCTAYVARDIAGLNRLWPNMEPAWRAEFREAFAAEGELVCVFESVNIVRTSDEFTATARLLTQLPGGAQRRRQLALTLVPVRDRLVIGNIRVR